MTSKTFSLSPSVVKVVRDKGTEQPFSGEYDECEEAGTYLCRQCGLALFRSATKFHSGCGWPSFDDELAGTVKRIPDSDQQRTEILCNRCDAHLGHVFKGEGFTAKNLRHCVNSLSLDFVKDLEVIDTEEAIVAAGCFWGVEYYFQKLPGVLKTEVGYIGGAKDFPSYEEVCQKDTDHYEALRIIFDKNKISYESIIKFFFEIHDFSQVDGQGPDVGPQYLSAIFYYSETQKNIINKVIALLDNVATRVLPVKTFWQAEEYHQNYYQKNKQQPYCHRYTKRFPPEK